MRISTFLLTASAAGLLLGTGLSHCGAVSGETSDVHITSCSVDPMNLGEVNLDIINTTHTQQDYLFNVSFGHGARASGSVHNVIPGEHRPSHLTSDVHVNGSPSCHLTYSHRISSDSNYGFGSAP